LSDTIKPGTVVYMKTTEEPLFVLSLNSGEPQYAGFSGSTLTVRRPQLSEHGLRYIVEDFLTEEIETLDEKNARQYSEITNRFGSFTTAKPALDPGLS